MTEIDCDAIVFDLDGVLVDSAACVNEPKDYPYGMRDFDVPDLDGNHLCFGMESKSTQGQT